MYSLCSFFTQLDFKLHIQNLTKRQNCFLSCFDASDFEVDRFHKKIIGIVVTLLCKFDRGDDVDWMFEGDISCILYFIILGLCGFIIIASLITVLDCNNNKKEFGKFASLFSADKMGKRFRPE